MSEKYFDLKRKLEELGYNNTLPIEAVSLVECILADLLQTTRSLQHYMDLSKEALMQRDKLAIEVEPYKTDNAKLIQENNDLHKECMILKENFEKQSRDGVRKIKSLTEEVMKKDSLISKLQHDVRDLSLRGLCAGTQSYRNKIRRKDCGDDSVQKICTCNEFKTSIDNDLLEQANKIQVLEEKNNAYVDEIILLKKQVENRDSEIIRLNIILEGGRPLNAISLDYHNSNSDTRVEELRKQLQEIESTNDLLQKELNNGLGKQHEAMFRALNLADENKHLKNELEKVDALALRVEEDCNKKLSAMMKEIHSLQCKLENLIARNTQLELLFAQKEAHDQPLSAKYHESLNTVLKEKSALQQEVKDLFQLNKNLQEKILALSQKNYEKLHSNDNKTSGDNSKYATREDLNSLFDTERKSYEKHMAIIQEKLNDTIGLFDKHLARCRNKETPSSPNRVFIHDLHNKLCESEQKILMLKKENEELQNKINRNQDNNKQNYKDIISQLNNENSELLKDNLSLSRQLNQHKHISNIKSGDCTNTINKDTDRVKKELVSMKYENEVLSKDRQEYRQRYKESQSLIETLKKDLILKQKQVDQLQEENCSYKITNRTGKASTDRLKDECDFLREQIKRMQTDVIKEKTLANQIKNIQIETERSSNEMQNELLSAQKQISIQKSTIESLNKKCRDLQTEISSLNADKNNCVESIRKIDKDRDQLVIELDHKTETLCALENKLKSQTYEIERLENEITDLNRKLNVNKVAEHKLIDNDAQIKFLRGEISRLTQQFDNALMENKQLQNSLADVNGSLKVTKIEYENSRKEVDGLKQQLQHYVAEIRRIEELLSQKEAERSDMLEHFASLSVEANILENTNHSLESESVSKTLQLQSYVTKIEDLEAKLLDKDNIIDSQAAKIASFSCKVTSLESEVKLVTEEKNILEKNISYLKQMCSNLNSEKSHIVKGIGDTDSELKLYENKIRSLSCTKTQLETEKIEMAETLQSTEKLLSNARKEVIELKLALQDATMETKLLQEHINRANKKDADFHEEVLTREELELPLMLDEINEESNEEDENSARYQEIRKRLSKYSHSGTL